ncbi:MAG: PDZ domain-containing protein [Verrucomicrobiota bacterium]|nr:PDZ domain-containing protein [Verrucomicrobiota bacterium]
MGKWVCLLLSFVWTPFLVVATDLISVDDVPRIMERFFSLHLQHREWNELLVRRQMRIYLEQFDHDRSYLMEDEVAPFLSMSDERVATVLEHVRAGDYSDFFELNQLIQRSIFRARYLRSKMQRELISSGVLHKPVVAENSKKPSFPELISDNLALASIVPIVATPSRQRGSKSYPRTLEDMVLKQRERLVQFYQFHAKRSSLRTEERRAKVCSLYEKKVQRMENFYLFLDGEGARLSSEKAEHLFSVRLLKSFARSLDTHTAFFSPEEAADMRLSLEKQFEGIGVILSEGVDGVVIAELIRGGPAEQSGEIQVEDRLMEIDGKSVQNLSLEEVLDVLKNKRSEIVLGLQRVEGGKESFFRVSLKKRAISMKEERIQASYEVVEGGVIGKISLYSFYENSDGICSEKDIKEAIREFQRVGELKGLVLDLRENAGGFLGQAVHVAGLFLGNGVVVISKYGNGETHYLRNLTGRRFFSGPLVVLTSKMSASAAEIVAQALQDYGVALVVGDERTFGKGSIQYQTITDEHARLFLKVTVGRYYTVSGRSTQIEGVKADIVVPSHYAPYRVGERYLDYPLPVDRVAPAYRDPLTDLDERSRALFRKRYLPTLQPVVTTWQEALPALKEASRIRLSESESFQVFMKRVTEIRQDQSLSFEKMEDLQMDEAVSIVKDMIQVQSVQEEQRELLPTGS